MKNQVYTIIILGCIVAIIILVFFVPHGGADTIDSTLSSFNKPQATVKASQTGTATGSATATGNSNQGNPNAAVSPVLKIDVTPVAAPSQLQSPYNNTTYSGTSTEVATHVAETSQNATLAEANSGFSPQIIIIVPRVLTTTLTLTNSSDYKFFTCSGLAINAALAKGVNSIPIDTNPGVSGTYMCFSGPNNDIQMKIIEE